MAKKLKPKAMTRDDHIARAHEYNNLDLNPDYETLLKHLGLTKLGLVRWVNRYHKMRRDDPSLPALKNRDNDDYIEKLYQWPESDYSPVKAGVKRALKYGHAGFFITAAQFGAPVNADALAAAKQYCKYHNYKLVIMVIQYGTIHKKNRKTGQFELTSRLSSIITDDPDITVVYPDVERLYLNENLALNTMRLRPTLNDHLSGLGPTGDSVSQIFAAPVIREEAIAVSNDDIPKLHVTTGAITHPRYKDEKAGRRAVDAHCYGGTVVEVLNSTHFHLRHMLMDKDGLFYDVQGMKCRKYTPEGVTNAPAAVDSVIPGDYHNGETDPVVREVLFGKSGVFPKLKPLFGVMHDYFNGEAISHHDEKSAIQMARKAKEGKLSLKDELDAGVAEIRFFLESAPKKTTFVFVRSNHDEFLDRWIDDANRGSSDHNNADMYHYLSWLKINEQDNKQSAISCYVRDTMAPAELKRVHFLTRDEDFVRPPIKKVGIKLDLHGDKGIAGSRGSIAQFNRLAFRTITGHTHAPGIFGSAWRVGTSSLLDLGYNDGPSNWMHTFGIVFENGQRMLINIIDGKCAV